MMKNEDFYYRVSGFVSLHGYQPDFDRFYIAETHPFFFLSPCPRYVFGVTCLSGCFCVKLCFHFFYHHHHHHLKFYREQSKSRKKWRLNELADAVWRRVID